MAREPMRDYRNQMLNYGIGRAFADDRPVVTRGMMAEANNPDDPSTLVDNISRLLSSGGLSRVNEIVKSNASDIEKLIAPPKNIKEATKQVIKKGTPDDFEPFVVPKEGEPGVGIVRGGKGTSTPPGTKVFTDAVDAKSVPGTAMSDSQNERGRGNIYDSLAALRENSKKKAAPVDEANENLFKQAMSDFIKEARGAPAPGETEVKSLDEYKKEFADATGIEIEKVDKSSALMALGLGLMQNRAGKGFNLGRILNAVGEAGGPALAELKEARAETRANAAAAGKYALEMRGADQEKAKAAAIAAQQRGKYYIMPKSEGASGFLSVMDEAVPEFLNSNELNTLVTNPDFSAEYDVITADRFNTIVDAALDTPEAAQIYGSAFQTEVSLLGEEDGISNLFTFKVNNPDPDGPGGPSLMVDQNKEGQIVSGLAGAMKDLDSLEDSFATAIAAIDEGAATLPAQVGTALLQAFDRMGFDVDSDTSTAGLAKFLQRFQAENASDILGEAGKTLSDTDRKLVADIVGQLPSLLRGSPDELKLKLEEMYDKVIVKNRRKIRDAFSTLDRYTPKSDYSIMYTDSEWTDEKEEALLKLREEQGANKDG